jgi:hypothetical protein
VHDIVNGTVVDIEVVHGVENGDVFTKITPVDSFQLPVT